ncbi:Sodium/hydrogen exchanger family-domain-containing protein [Blastocladiella britannica]|nr:Sodium/hydrogen exchanger family-domain-containing protein [Blastocladiella britannica]
MTIDFNDFTANNVPVISTIFGLFLVIFGLSSSIVKERLYLSEAVLSTMLGTIVGPHVLGLFTPQSWSGLNGILLETSRLVIAMQIMAAIICLPLQYYKVHWKSIFTLLVPVMVAAWLISAALVYWIMGLPWDVSLAIGAALAPTDPILANSIVKGKFADKHVPRHVRHLLSGESACNDSTAALFVGLAVMIIESKSASAIAKEFFIYNVAYEIGVGCAYGLIIGWLARHALHYAELHDWIDQENFLTFAIALAIFTDGSAVLLHANDFIAVFIAAIAFSWDGSFYEASKTSQIQEVLDNLANSWFFVFNGAIIPWPLILRPPAGYPDVWQYFAVAAAILALRRLPVTLLFYRLLPSLTSVKEALFVGHFGPMAAGSLYYLAFLIRELSDQHGGSSSDHPHPTISPGSSLGGSGLVHVAIEPTIAFVVVASIAVHGSSVSFFKLGSTAVRTLSLGSSLGRRTRSLGAASGRAPRAPLTPGTFTVSAPINPRPLYSSAMTGGGVGVGSGLDVGGGESGSTRASTPVLGPTPADSGMPLYLSGFGNVRETAIAIHEGNYDDDSMEMDDQQQQTMRLHVFTGSPPPAASGPALLDINDYDESPGSPASLSVIPEGGSEEAEADGSGPAPPRLSEDSDLLLAIIKTGSSGTVINDELNKDDLSKDDDLDVNKDDHHSLHEHEEKQ